MSAYMYLASAAWMLLVCGWLNRKTRRRHVPLVLTGIFIDIALVLTLEVTRHAVETALSFDRSALQQVHIAVSTVAFTLYFPVLVLGYRLFYNPGDRRVRALHKKIAAAALIFRTLGFMFMFSMLT